MREVWLLNGPINLDEFFGYPPSSPDQNPALRQFIMTFFDSTNDMNGPFAEKFSTIFVPPGEINGFYFILFYLKSHYCMYYAEYLMNPYIEINLLL